MLSATFTFSSCFVNVFFRLCAVRMHCACARMYESMFAFPVCIVGILPLKSAENRHCESHCLDNFFSFISSCVRVYACVHNAVVRYIERN